MPDVTTLPIDEIFTPKMLHGAIVGSRIRKGEIRSIRLPELPESIQVYSADDIPGENVISIGKVKMPALAHKKVSYAGQPILLLASPDLRMLEWARGAVEIVYQREEPFDLGTESTPDVIDCSAAFKRGKPDENFKKAFQIVEGDYEIKRHIPNTTTPVGAFAFFAAGECKISATSRWIYHVRSSVARFLRVNENTIGVSSPALGGAGEGYLWIPSLLSCFAALLSAKCQVPVRLILSPAEKRLMVGHRPGAKIHHTTALTKEGDLLASEIDLQAECGAFPFFSQQLVDRLCLGSVGSFVIPNLVIRGKVVKTSLPPTESFIGFGIAPGIFAAEVHASRLAELNNENPAHFRHRHYLKRGDTTHTTEKVIHTPLDELLQEVEKKSDFARKYDAFEVFRKRKGQKTDIVAPLKGVGIAGGELGGGFTENSDPGCTVSVYMDEEGKLQIRGSSILKSAATTQFMRRSTASVLGLKDGDISITNANTALTPDSGPAILSRNLLVVRRLIDACCQAIQKKRFRSPLPLEIKRTYRRPRYAGWDRDLFVGKPFRNKSWGTTVVEVEISPVTLEIGVKGVWIAVDAGTIVDKELARKVVENELVNAFEWSRGYDTLEKDSLTASVFPPQLRMIPIVDIIFRTTHAADPGAMEGLVFSTFAPAFISAISQATGFYFDSLPLSRSLVFQYTEA